MSALRAWTRVLVAISFVTGVTSLGLAEVSISGPSQRPDTLVLSIVVDDPDPVGVWAQYRPISSESVLNVDGHLRGDGRPDIAFTPITDDPAPIGSWPQVVWAYNTGSDHDIAFSEWTGSSWSVTEFLTSGTDDELDPRIYVEADGTVHVVWWKAGANEKVYLTTRPAGSATWDSPVLVTTGSEEGRRPSVAVLSGELRVAYERDSNEPGMAQDVVVATQQPGGGFAIDLVGSTTRTDRLDAMIHEKQGHLWLDWKHDPAEFGCAEYQNASWGLGTPEPWTDPSWVGVEETRKAIRNQVVGN